MSPADPPAGRKGLCGWVPGHRVGRMSEIVFFVPPSLETAGGGSAYNRHLIAALRGLGCRVATSAVANGAEARQGWAALAGPAVGVIDGMVLRHFDAGAGASWLDGRAAALVHHPTALAEPAERDLIRAAERRVLPRLGRVVATSKGVGARLVAEFGVSARRLRVVVPGLADLPRSPGSGQATCHILSVGRLAPRKGHDVLLRALARLPDLDWRLTIAGDSHGEAAWAEELGTLAAGLAIGHRMELLERPAGAALEQLWETADLFALASRRETTGIAVAEALRRGVPVAITGCDAPPRDAGASCQPEDDAALSLCLRRMIFDRALRQHMSETAWTAGQSLPGWPAQARRFLDALAAAEEDSHAADERM